MSSELRGPRRHSLAARPRQICTHLGRAENWRRKSPLTTAPTPAIPGEELVDHQQGVPSGSLRVPLPVSEPCASVIKQMSDLRMSWPTYEDFAVKRNTSVAKRACAFQAVTATSPMNWPRLAPAG
eukprot:9310946-Pyramimonas_sp.AAC.1